MIIWKNSLIDKPQDTQMCFITQGASLISSKIVGPVSYKESEDTFVDMFAEPAYGLIYDIKSFKDNPLFWCADNEINLPDGPAKDKN